MKKLKRIFLLAALLCTTVFNLQSQINLLPDSIRRQVDTMNVNNVDRFFLFRAWGIMNTDPGRAMMLAKAHTEKGLLLKDTIVIANSHVTRGAIYTVVGDVPRSISELVIAVKLYKAINDSLRMASALNNLGNTYRENRDYDKAIQCQEQALQIRLAKRDSSKILTSYVNLATAAFSKKDYKNARLLTLKGMPFRGNKKDEIAALYNNYAAILAKLGRYDSAVYYLNEVPALVAGDPEGLKKYYIASGSVYLGKGDLKKAETQFMLAVKLMQEQSDTYGLANMEELLYTLYKAKGNYSEALAHYEKMMVRRDSLNTQEKNLQTALLSTEFGLSQKEAEIENLKQKSILDEQEKSKIKIVRNSVIAGILLTLLLVVVSYRKARERKRFSDELSLKNNEITDSINYAKRIQEAILPSDHFIGSRLKEYFIIYQPKDIVAGDFYWMEENKDYVWFALADCTGHGVPGALVSVVCSNALNSAIKEYKLTEPGEILDQVRSLIVERFSGTSSNVKDGMDVSLVKFSKAGMDGEQIQLQWAGANNSLFYYSRGELKKVQAHKQPIGFVHNPSSFPTHDLMLDKGDVLYFFTDGYYDQFGGPDGKKFKNKRLQQLLLDQSLKPLQEQEHKLRETIISWKGNLEQTDDICVIGIKV